MKIVVIDSGPLGLATHPRPRGDARACQDWIGDHLDAGSRIMVPEVADNEVRRELIRAHRQRGLQTADDARLDADVIIATTNVGHLARFCDAALWSDILPD